MKTTTVNRKFDWTVGALVATLALLVMAHPADAQVMCGDTLYTDT